MAADLDIEHVLCTRFEVVDGKLTGDARRPAPLGGGQTARGRAARDRPGRRPRRRASRTPTAARTTSCSTSSATPARRTRRVASSARRASAAGRCTGSHGRRGADARPRGAPRRRARRVPHRHRHRHRPRHPQPEQGRRGQHDDLGGRRPRPRHRRASTSHVLGEEHVWSHRPAVFLFNHQSSIDPRPADGPAPARRDRGRQEGARGQPGRAARGRAGRRGVHRPRRPRRGRSPRCGRWSRRRSLRGKSLAVAPEGTRSGTGRLGPFKKGAFRLAMAGGVPVVPIVFRNANDVWPLGTQFMRPGTVDVVVHPPDPDRRLDRREPRRPHRRRARPLPRHARELAGAG